MAVQKQKERASSVRDDEVTEKMPESDHSKRDEEMAASEALLDEIDDLMAEIDAAEFVRGYVQKGGQ